MEPDPQDIIAFVDAMLDFNGGLGFCEATDGEHECGLEPDHAGQHTTLGAFRFA